MPSRRSWRRFFSSFFPLFIIYLVLVPAIFFILDAESALKAAKKDWANFVTNMMSIALLISSVLAIWLRKDPALRNW